MQQLPFLNSQRTFWGWGKGSDGNGNEDDGKIGKAVAKKIDISKADEKTSSSPSRVPQQGDAAAEKAGSQLEAATSESDGGLVPVSAGALRKDTGPPFEPRMLALPLQTRPLIPGQHQLVQITHQGVIEEINKAFSGNSSSPAFVATFLRRKEASSEALQEENAASEDLAGVDPLEALYSTGTRARIVQAAPFSKNDEKGDAPTPGLQVLLHGRDLVRMDKVLDAGPPLHVQVSKSACRKVRPTVHKQMRLRHISTRLCTRFARL
jgi:hypothetical protein